MLARKRCGITAIASTASVRSMHCMKHLLTCTATILLLAACAGVSDPETKPLGENALTRDQIRAAKSGPVDFAAHVRPILESKCAICHNRATLPGHMSLENRRAAMRTGTLGAYIVPGHPEKSLLISHVRSGHQNVSVMPAVGDRLTDDEYEILKKWVSEGAKWPEGATGVLQVQR